MQLTPPASDFPNKIRPWPPPIETVLMVTHLFGFWLLRVGSLIKPPPSNWIRFLSGVRGVWGFKMPDYCCDISSWHHSINRAFKEHTPTHSGKSRSSWSRLSNRTDGRWKNMLPMGISASWQREGDRNVDCAAINIDVTTTVTMMTVGSKTMMSQDTRATQGVGSGTRAR